MRERVKDRRVASRSEGHDSSEMIPQAQQGPVHLLSASLLHRLVQVVGACHLWGQADY